MHTIVLDEPGRFTHTETPLPHEPGAGEALVRVHRVGVCGTDLHAYRGRQPFFSYPRILGHELGVEVLTVGEGVENVRPGDRCAVEPYLNCGTCIACRHGKTNCCISLKVLGVHTDGGMRERIVVPAAKLHRSETLAFEQLALVETLAVGAHAVGRAALGSDETVLVIGAGPIGLSVIAFAKAAGARVVALDTNQARLDLACINMGVEATVLSADDPVEAMRAATGGDPPTAVFDATGNAASMHAAFGHVAPGGRLVFVGLFQGDVTFNDPDFHRRELTLLATRNATADDFRRVLDAVEAGRVDTAPWVTHRAAASNVAAQFPAWLDPQTGVVKAVVEF